MMAQRSALSNGAQAGIVDMHDFADDTERNGTPAPLPLAGKVAWITGGGRGLGRALAQAVAAAGATVVVTARSPDQLAETVALIEQGGGRALAFVCDVTAQLQVERTYAAIQGEFTKVDLLINNAGLWGPIAPLWETEPSEWWRTLEIHLLGSMLHSHTVLPAMIERRQGCIINIVSHAGVHRWPTCSAYAISKSATIKLTEHIAVETRRSGVVSFAVHPGIVMTGLTDQALKMEAAPESAAARAAAWIRQEVSEGHAVSAQEAAQMIVTLATGAADRLSGRYLTVHDDLATLIAQADEIQSQDSYTLKLREHSL
jgi:NAD(P)-dependent dehydrogenase (short-subunit alcohol dehydrogenase family)